MATLAFVNVSNCEKYLCRYTQPCNASLSESEAQNLSMSDNPHPLSVCVSSSAVQEVDINTQNYVCKKRHTKMAFLL